MMRPQLLIALSLMAAAAGCASRMEYPAASRVQGTDTVTAVLIRGVPSGAFVQMNGRVLGPATDKRGKPIPVPITEGTSMIEVLVDGRVTMLTRVFVGAGSTSIVEYRP
jgi:hypothetical protein